MKTIINKDFKDKKIVDFRKSTSQEKRLLQLTCFGEHISKK